MQKSKACPEFLTEFILSGAEELQDKLRRRVKIAENIISIIAGENHGFTRG